MSRKRIPGVVVIDHERGRITVDGDELLPAHYIAEGVGLELIMDGRMARVDLGIYAENVLVVTKRGVESPTAEAEAKRIVREGLRDVLVWLGEEAA